MIYPQVCSIGFLPFLVTHCVSLLPASVWSIYDNLLMCYPYILFTVSFWGLHALLEWETSFTTRYSLKTVTSNQPLRWLTGVDCILDLVYFLTAFHLLQFRHKSVSFGLFAALFPVLPHSFCCFSFFFFFDLLWFFLFSFWFSFGYWVQSTIECWRWPKETLSEGEVC